MSDRKLIRGARVVPLDGRRSLKRGDVLIDNGVLSVIGGVRDYSGAIVQQTRSILLPGFVQAYLHLEHSLLDRDFVPDARPRDLDHQLASWDRCVDETLAPLLVRAGLGRGLLSGTTSFASVVHPDRWQPTARAALALGLRVVLVLDGRHEGVERALDAIAEWHRAQPEVAPRTRAAVFVGDAERSSGRRLRRLGALSLERDVPLLVRLGARPHDRGGLARLERAVALHRRTVLVLGTGGSLSGGEVPSELASAAVSLILAPGHALLVGAPMPPIETLLAAQIPIGLGSFSGATRTGFDVFKELRLLSRVLAGRVREPASTALEIASRGGAAALGLEVGEVVVGRPADLMAVDVLVDEEADHETVCRLLIERGGPSQIRTVWADGQVLAANGRVARGEVPDARMESSARAFVKAEADRHAYRAGALLRWSPRGPWSPGKLVSG